MTCNHDHAKQYGPSGFPNVIGAIDCTHVPIKDPPGPNEGDFVNRKRVHSVNVQVSYQKKYAVDWLKSLRWCVTQEFSESHLCTLFERGKGTYKCQAHSITHTYAKPNKTAFFHYTGDFDGIPLGDRGYACRQYFMTPFPGPTPGPQTRYNAALARTRARIEMTFGQLKERFQCLRAAPDRACDIIVDMNLNNGDNKNIIWYNFDKNIKAIQHNLFMLQCMLGDIDEFWLMAPIIYCTYIITVLRFKCWFIKFTTANALNDSKFSVIVVVLQDTFTFYSTS